MLHIRIQESLNKILDGYASGLRQYPSVDLYRNGVNIPFSDYMLDNVIVHQQNVAHTLPLEKSTGLPSCYVPDSFQRSDRVQNDSKEATITHVRFFFLAQASHSRGGHLSEQCGGAICCFW